MGAKKVLTIEDIAEKIIDYRGKTPPKTDNGVRLITAKVIKNGFIQEERAEYISQDFYNTWMRRGYPQQHDIVITTEAPLGEVAQLRTSEKVALAQRVILLRAKQKVMDQQYFYQALKSPIVQANMQQRATGTTVLGIKQSELRKVEVPYFSLPTQSKIAAILSAYDDLIANNLRRVKILEEMAQNLYREWFVNFRFPGHEQTRFADSPLGRIPEGWKISTLGEQLVALESGKRPKGGIKEISNGIPSIGAENINGIGKHNYQNEKYVSLDFFNSMKKGKVKDRDIGIYKDGAYIGKSTYFRDGFPHDTFCINEHVFLLRADGSAMTQNQLYLWLQESSTVSAIRATNANAAQPGINQNSIGGLQITVALEKVVSDFDYLVDPFLAQVINLAKRNLTLSQTRDLLLSKLISGEADVSELDIKVPEEEIV